MNKPTTDKFCWGIMDTGVGILALYIGYCTIPALIYYIGTGGYDAYQSIKPQEPLIFQSQGWKNYLKNGH